MKRFGKDPKIESWFSSYGGEKPSQTVTSRGKAKVCERGSRPLAKKGAGWRPALALAAACLVCAMCFGGYLTLGRVQKEHQQAQVEANRAPAVTGTYSDANIGTLRLSAAEVGRDLPDDTSWSWMSGEDVEIGEVRLFRFKDEEGNPTERLAFVMIQARFAYKNSYVDATVRVETSEESYDRFSDYRKLPSRLEIGAVDVHAREQESGEYGEYVSAAYFEKDGMRWYLDTLSPEEGSFEHVLLRIVRS